jgi:hypothetical protein
MQYANRQKLPLYIGSFTSGDILAVLFVGPIEPATKRGLSGFLAVHSSATSRAILPIRSSIHKQCLQMIIGHSDSRS